ncbi:3D domain-containing protein [Sporomusa sp.]|uniref:3D domain-containing protein n=1 Tax=Sporomusa sp. TaxID=2078658 RepID=UPI002BBF64DC|nr:3D domain-containing protein [Sporomusa sp.]HWR07890.1 3D domain-containing protein [Sporomusa sp.]
MKNQPQRKQTKSLKRRLKRIAATAAVAGAALVSSALLPGIPATAHASAVPPDHANQPKAANHQMVKSPKGHFNLQSDSRVPQKKLAKAQAKAAAAAQRSQQTESKTPVAPTTSKQTTSKQTTSNQTPTKQTTKKVQASPAAKAPADSAKVLEIKATAYAPGEHDNGQWGDKTFLGTTVRPGVVAVDPKIIPLGSRVYIEYPDGTGHYAVAEDTGGAIKGNRIDIAMQSVDKAYDFGIKNVKVHVLGKDA